MTADVTPRLEQEGVLMRLADFIQANTERILDDAVEFATTQTPVGVKFDVKTLRNDIPLILRAIVLDLRTAQSPAQQRAKAEGRAPERAGPESAATSHGRSRADDGFGVNQMIAEYRALRASVLRLWAADEALVTASIEDMIRFNEAIDQAVAESLAEFSRTEESWRNVFLGALGHDLRGPLHAVIGTAELLADSTRDTPYARQAERILKGAVQLGQLVDSLLDYCRSTLGAGMGLKKSVCDLGKAVAEEVDLLRAALPEAPLTLQVTGTVHGDFDEVRIREAVHNLVTNAAKYGDERGEIDVSVTGEDVQVRVSVSNTGEPLSSDTINALFDPLRRGSSSAHKGEHASLGLGLFIVREIARAHGGEVTAHSGGRITTFAIVLPRRSDAAAMMFDARDSVIVGI
ncbi:HAMP domain-containing sensor histidine kinase [Pseudoxanthomonas sp. PXM01]|uniref:sensor histidine kinase n=1 Tax=Pseudoxanthomonas sp. PXM01 TaxID=2769295 RepID=UPI001780215B|nr:HAMP domain-containing sensor histidine kinase [Pseudoxanthomonas sp. PXM01]MBD9469469.1 HAMP domain-containing histidine kinase [Pseudoxanthomonas sp. PXM01]